MNGHQSDIWTLDQAGLSQGTPLSAGSCNFFNADLVQRCIDATGGAIAFVDDFTAWVTGPTAHSNRDKIKVIEEEAMYWEKRSAATFEADKMAFIHFIRSARKIGTTPVMIKGQAVAPRDHVKILGVIMDTRLTYKQHIARASTKGLEAATKLKRLRGLSAATARQQFASTVIPLADYAANVWMHAYQDKLIRPIKRVQKAGAQAIVGTFLTVAAAVAEAEVSLHCCYQLERIEKAPNLVRALLVPPAQWAARRGATALQIFLLAFAEIRCAQ